MHAVGTRIRPAKAVRLSRPLSQRGQFI